MVLIYLIAGNVSTDESKGECGIVIHLLLDCHVQPFRDGVGAIPT